MDRISGKSLFSHLFSSRGDKGNFSAIQSEYNKFMKKAAKSDLSASVTLAQKEIEILTRLITAAEAEGKEDTLKDLKARLELLQEVVKENNPREVIYYPPVLHAAKQSSGAEEVQTGEIPEETEEEKRIHSFFTEDSDSDISDLIKKCKNLDGSISPEVIDVTEQLSKLGLKVNSVAYFMGELLKENEKGEKIIDSSLVERFQKFYKNGFTEGEAISLLSYIEKNNFLDSERLSIDAVKMRRIDIPEDKIREIFDILQVKDDETKKNKVSPAALSNIRTIKNILAATRAQNDTAERNNPINFKDKLILVTSNKITIVCDKEGMQISSLDDKATYKELLAEYERLLSERENKLLVGFTKKYKTRTGEINQDAMRAITSLRRYGVTTDNLLTLTDFCLDKGQVNIDKLNLVSRLKSAGALSKDIAMIISAIQIDENGKYNDEDIENACDLTSAVIGGKEVVSLLPEVRGNKDVKDHVLFLAKHEEAIQMADELAEVITGKDNIILLTSLIKKNDGTVDETAVEMLETMIRHFAEGKLAIDESSFVGFAEAIITAAYNKNTDCIDEEAAGISSVMLGNGEPLENVLEGINICKDNEGIINPNLSEILWKLSLDKTSFSDIKTVVQSCKNQDGLVNNVFAKTILSMFEHGDKSEKIISMIKNQSAT